MKKISYSDLRAMWLGFLSEKEHEVIPSASVVPENDASTLFTTAGMQPLIPYLIGNPHPTGRKRLANIQKCIRTNDIDEVGDISHLTFFEMMGNWSLGGAPEGYFKCEKCAWSYEFLTDKKYLNLDKNRIHVTCFAGDKVASRDEECAGYWQHAGVPREHIHFLPKSENWWALGSGVGPQGPCSEMFFDMTLKACGQDCNPSCSCGRFVELGNDVYMQYVCETTGEPIKTANQFCVDTGWGLERILCFVNGYSSVFESELFKPAMDLITKNSKVSDTAACRILAEHTRAATIIIGDGVVPSNTAGGYVLRRLIRRAVRMANWLTVPCGIYEQLIDFFISYLGLYYSELKDRRDTIVQIFMDEVARFEKTLEVGLREFEKVATSMRETLWQAITSQSFEKTKKAVEDMHEAMRKEKDQGFDETKKEIENLHVAMRQATAAQDFGKTRKAIENMHVIMQKVVDNKGFEKVLMVAGHMDIEQFKKNVTELQNTARELDGGLAFKLYETYGFPIELTQELAQERGLTINMEEYNARRKEHASLSATAAAGAFKGGLVEGGTETMRLHTATHILLAVLREMYGTQVMQKGSNITAERLRFDFNLERKLGDDELRKIEQRVNEIITTKLAVTFKEMSLSEAKEMGATGTFTERYGDKVRVYSIGNFAHEICGGPHAMNTGELGTFKILKEESVASGVRRVKAVLS